MTQPPARRIYRNPPIEEALVELRFPPVSDWDPTLPGKLHERVKAEYSGKPQQLRLIQTSVRAEPGQEVEASTREHPAGARLTNADGTRALSIGPSVLSVHVLRPYDGWARFRARIETAVKAYADLSESAPVSRIAVRYINRIVIPAAGIDIGRYFFCGPAVPEGIPERISAFWNRSEHTFADGTNLLLTFATLQTDPGSAAFLLDLEVAVDGHFDLEMDAILRIIDDHHDREERAFESLITDATREVFDAP